MLSGVGLAHELWAVVFDITCYLINQSPRLELVNNTPHELWYGQKPFVAHLRVFGCDAFVHVPKEKKRNLNNKVEKCIFIGCKGGVKI